ncbi:hypothetical protein BDV95DRAFT_493446 [Massariosphaeria phaeospora]|uniref:Integral membrane protein n=1 Tax=Massariosphaeria phaeospora TaxID=100035 RepID=A0A7C8I6I7_9PLEO|nr:hypothetical protein BDV95DRAFT_493446 [Massariosphaeria phaeospora]
MQQSLPAEHPGRRPRPSDDQKQTSTRDGLHSTRDGRAKRNKTFHPAYEPLKEDTALDVETGRITGPLPFLNPTKARFRPTSSLRPASDAHENPPPPISFKWTSRNNRKGRHAITVDTTQVPPELKHTLPRRTASSPSIAHGIWRMLTVFPVWDVSYDVAAIFTIGSVVWVINAFFIWLPLVKPETEFTNEVLYGGGISAFIGATIFVLGSILLMMEAVNANRSGCFGWALEQAFSHETENGLTDYRVKPSGSHCTHHHSNKRNLVGKGPHTPTQSKKTKSSPQSRNWVWFPSMAELHSHYIHELGFLASLVQLVAASIFWISGLTALPGIYDRMSRTEIIVLYWTPQVIGGTGFIISGLLFMLETQSHWYKPAPRTLGWWIGVWNLIGGIGFTLCPAFGYDESSWAQYQACLSTFWGSWAFLVGSVVQWYESLAKYPVRAVKSRG